MHRLTGHESKCAAFHGHRYVAEIAVTAADLDFLGRVIDFSVVKRKIGDWIDQNWDHTAILCRNDQSAAAIAIANANELAGHPVYYLAGQPTVENLVGELARVSIELLSDEEVRLAWIRLWETPNCSAIWVQN